MHLHLLSFDTRLCEAWGLSLGGGEAGIAPAPAPARQQLILLSVHAEIVEQFFGVGIFQERSRRDHNF